VDGRIAAQKRFLIFKPSVEKVVQAVKETSPAEAN